MLKDLHAGRRREKSGGKIFGILFFTIFLWCLALWVSR